MQAVRSRLPMPMLWAGVAGSSLLLGVAIARGGASSWLFVSLVGGAALVVIASELGFKALVFWLAASAALYPFFRFPTEQPFITFDRLWIGAMVMAVALEAKKVERARATRILLFTLAWLVVAFGLRAAFSADVAPHPLRVWIDAIVLPAGLFVITSRMVATPERCRKLAGAFVAAGLVLAVIGIAQKILGFDLSGRSGGTEFIDEAVDTVRISGPLSGPEVYSLSLVLCLAGTLYWTLIRGPAGYLVGGIAIAIELAAIGLTLFRAAWIAALVVIIVAVGFRPKHFGRLIGVAVLIGALALAGTQLQQSSAISERLQERENIYGRLAAYKEDLVVFRQAPLFGVGVGSFETAAIPISVTVGGVEALNHPHSSYLGILAEQGLWGFLALVAVTLAGWKLLRDFRARARLQPDVLLVAAVAGAAIAYVFISLTLTLLPHGPSNGLLAVLLGMAAGRLDALRDA